jgi:hypothetical protein
MLRNEPPFQALRLRRLDLRCYDMRSTVAAVAADLAAHPSLREVELCEAPLDTPAALDVIVDVALSLRLTKLKLMFCDVGPASAIAVPRLLRGDALHELVVDGGGNNVALLDAHAASLLADALHSNRTLRSLNLKRVALWRDVDAVSLLFGALVGHPSLMSITLTFNAAGDAEAAADALLGALVAANSPLRVLTLS